MLLQRWVSPQEKFLCLCWKFSISQRVPANILFTQFPYYSKVQVDYANRLIHVSLMHGLNALFQPKWDKVKAYPTKVQSMYSCEKTFDNDLEKSELCNGKWYLHIVRSWCNVYLWIDTDLEKKIVHELDGTGAGGLELHKTKWVMK